MIEFDDRLRRHVHDIGERLPLSPAGASAAIERGRSRRRRRRVATAVSLVMVTIAGAAATAQILDRQQAVDVAVGSPAATAGASSLDWRRVEPVTALGYTSTLLTTEQGVLYALSTAPGEAPTDKPASQALYRSTDGLDWAPVVLAGDMRIDDITAVDGRLYAIGTAAATAPIDPAVGVGDVVVAWTADDGSTWEQAVLPLDLRSLPTGGRVGVGATSIASTPFGLMVAVPVEAYSDVEHLLPAGTDASNGWRVTRTGVDVFAPPPESCEAPETTTPATVRPVPKPDGVGCAREALAVALSLTWAELGVDAANAELYGNPTRVFLARDGSDFQPVQLPVAPDVRVDQVELLATPTGVLAAATSWEGAKLGEPGTATVFTSADGTNWTSGLVPGLHMVLDTGILGGQLAVYGFAPDGAAILATSGDGVTWSTRRLADLVDTGDVPSQEWVDGVDIGPLGFVGALSTRPDALAAAGGVTITADGYTLTVLDEIGRATVTDQSGAVVAEVPEIWAASDGNSLTITDPATQQPLVSFDMATVERAIGEAWKHPGGGATYMLHSSDGVGWSVVPADQIAGEPVVSIVNVSVGVDAVRATALLRTDDADATSMRRTVFVGTPAA